MGVAQAAQGEIAEHARRHGRGIARLARAGYAAKGIIYLVIGGLAVRAATGNGGGATDSHGALATIGERAGGRALLLFMAVGLVGYAIWAIIAGVIDAEDRGDEPKGMALRAGQMFRGAAYGLLGIEAMRLMVHAARGSGGDRTEHWAARILSLPWGRVLVGIVAASVVAYAAYQLWRGARKHLQKHLRVGGADPSVIAWVVRLARFGIIARGVVFLIIGWFLAKAAWRSEAQEAGGVRESLLTLGAQPYGRVLLGVVAAGLIGYGVWQLANAKYREIRVA